MSSRLLRLAAAAAASLALGACSAGGGAPAAPAAAPAASAEGAPAQGERPALTAKEVADLGTVVVDQNGYTLYRFDEDSAKPPTTTCVGECATKWPPFVVDRNAKLRVDGVEDSAIGLLERPDGSTQLTIGGWAVYRFSGDTAPGAAEGQGVSGAWYAITPEGEKATPA
jgi:predicted lipoprotein with Yx(FWY)xxD motif